MGELQDADFADLAIDGAAVWAIFYFAALLVDSLADLSSAEVVEIWASKLLKKGSSVGFLKQDSATVLLSHKYNKSLLQKTLTCRAYLANFLEDGHDEPEVANMECRQRQSNMAKVPCAILQALLARRTFP